MARKAPSISQSLPQMFKGGSEECFDYNCTPCEDGDQIVEARHYCPTCDQLYCPACLKTHQRFPALKDHKVLGRQDKAEWGTRKPEDECPSHVGQVISMYCRSHDSLCCPVCASMNHRSSCDMGYLPEKAKGVAKSTEYLGVQENVKKIRLELSKLKTDRDNLKASLQRSKECAIEDMVDFKRRLMEALETLESQFLSDLDRQHADYEADIQSDIDATELMIAELDKLKQALDTKEKTNESLLFIRMKRCNDKCTTKANKAKAISEKRRICEMNFTPDSSLAECIGHAQSLGSPMIIDYRPDYKYTVDKSLSFSVKAKEDKNKCDVTGICQLSDGAVVIADHSNDSLKRLGPHGSSYQVVDRCKLSLKPTALCAVGHKEIAVTTTSKAILFVSVEDRMKLTRSLTLGHETYGLGYRDDKLYVTDMFSKLYVYSTSGELIQMIHSDELEKPVFSNARNIAVGTTDGRLYVTDKNKGLVTMDSHGNLMTTLQHKDVKGAWGVSVDPSGNVFVTTADGGTVVQVSCSGDKVLSTVANKSKGLERPWCVLYDKIQGRLLVSKNPVSQGCDIMNVFKMK